ncbi:hypothetical protein EJ05DRAFT_128118 [Pseudovirgaria hyperparasitica]|uniref:Cyclase n=1 Tax=Pseudovirgaria hyperparasitica TaxID=470096 RepID=A0A6A6W114_9PEZI|nr:uncharacterized protein EJ05DRAFT_128118 [Pseudovirgaria hyperparasitica]KAF2755267.1 hypothetical protein EJ05DRAFT_128118 [Pseudovirgaria hyperparasitica]
MTESARARLNQVKEFLTGKTPTTTFSLPFHPDQATFPTRKELPAIPGAPDGAAWVWGDDDWIGRINLLTPARVKAAASEIKTGDIVPTNLPLNVPAQPAFRRETFKHEIKILTEGLCYDDIYHLNTQSGTQWDGFRHFAHLPTGAFYNNTRAADIVGPAANHKCSMHHWAEHGIAGRGVLLDYFSWAQRHAITYDPYDYHAIAYDDLVSVGKEQGIDIRPAAQGGDIKVGDLLFVRMGWTVAYYARPAEERSALALREHKLGPDDGQRYVGLKQEPAIVDWLHDCYFGAVAGDAPTFEAWPTMTDYFLHEYILALWGMPLGEMLDLEKLSETCKKYNRWFFFFSSAPFNCPNGVSSHVNGNAIF